MTTTEKESTVTTSDETGFADVPWGVDSATDGASDGLPPSPPTPEGDCCPARWVGTEAGYRDWLCVRWAGHPGTHRAGDGVHTVAEWPAS